MKRSKNTIGAQVTRLRRLYNKRDEATMRMYNQKSDLKRAVKKIIMHALFVSDEGTFLIRGHVCESTHARDSQAWRDWLGEHYRVRAPSDMPGIISNILSGMHTRTGKFWRVHSIIGWHAHARRRPKNSRVSKARHKTKRKGRKNGHVRIRRRHRNA